MKSISISFIGHDHFLMNLCKEHLGKFKSVKCNSILEPEFFLKCQNEKKANVVIVDLPIDRQRVYEFGIQTKKIFPKSRVVAIAHRVDVGRLVDFQHIEKLFGTVLARDSAIKDIDRLVATLAQSFNIKSKRTSILDFTSKEKEIIRLTCRELRNEEIAKCLRISIRTVETHKSNIYGKLGAKNPAKLFNYALNSGLI